MSCNVGCGEPDANKKGTKDAFSVQQIKKAGGIMMCVTNTPEHCMFWETYNNITGVTRNPYDTRRTVGGSSGGEVGNKNLYIIIPKTLTKFYFISC